MKRRLQRIQFHRGYYQKVRIDINELILVCNVNTLANIRVFFNLSHWKCRSFNLKTLSHRSQEKNHTKSPTTGNARDSLISCDKAKWSCQSSELTRMHCSDKCSSWHRCHRNFSWKGLWAVSRMEAPSHLTDIVLLIASLIVADAFVALIAETSEVNSAVQFPASLVNTILPVPPFVALGL